VGRGFSPARADDAEQVGAEQVAADRVGIELEMLPMGLDGERAPHDVVRAVVDALGPLASGTSVTFEPGGQLELSTPPAPDVDAACALLESDLARMAAPLAERGIVLLGSGIDPSPTVGRVIRGPRYDAMEAYFTSPDADWANAGRTMMCATAGLQVNLDLDARHPESDTRWGLVHVLGPTLAATFANSPLVAGVPSGWKSYRLATWWRLDPSRTRSAGGRGPWPGKWGAYVMDAQVMLIRGPDGECVPVRESLTFGEWVDRGHPLGFPTLDDLDYHLTTLFPPVRPRGWLELRMVDSLPRPWWRVPVAVATALVYDDEAGEAAAQAAWDTAEMWVAASRSGLAHPDLAASAEACFRIALKALERMGTDRATTDVVAAYLDRYVVRGRCPADDVLDHWRRTGGRFLPGEQSWAAAPPAGVRP
jgi:glutamate--cysteine ligase